jgi:predicted dehydrogenase
MNNLHFTDLADEARSQGRRDIMVTGPGHPYVEHFWPSGHIIGYEHTFIATLADFLSALSRGDRFHPDFSDALEVQRLLEAVVDSNADRRWIEVAEPAGKLKE